MLTAEVVDIGIFKLTRYGSLKVKERDWFNKDRIENAKYSLKLAEIANAIAVDYDIEPEQALNIVSNPEPGNKMLLPYAGDLADLPDRLYLDMTLTSRSVTMFMRSRLPADYLSKNSQMLEQAFGIVADPDDGWKQEYTDELPESAIEEIVKFMNSETRRGEPEPEPIEETSLGEESASGEKQPKQKRKGTGNPATGASS